MQEGTLRGPEQRTTAKNFEKYFNVARKPQHTSAILQYQIET